MNKLGTTTTSELQSTACHWCKGESNGKRKFFCGKCNGGGVVYRPALLEGYKAA